jgi:hypothetical protein
MSHHVEAEDLISHLSAGLTPADRANFRKAAEAVPTQNAFTLIPMPAEGGGLSPP